MAKGGGMHGRGVRIMGGMHGGGCVAGGAWQGGLHAGETATEAGGTHPPGMHSCLTIKTFCCSMK